MKNLIKKIKDWLRRNEKDLVFDEKRGEWLIYPFSFSFSGGGE